MNSPMGHTPGESTGDVREKNMNKQKTDSPVGQRSIKHFAVCLMVSHRSLIVLSYNQPFSSDNPNSGRPVLSAGILNKKLLGVFSRDFETLAVLKMLTHGHHPVSRFSNQRSNCWICVINAEQCFISLMCVLSMNTYWNLVYRIMHEMEIRLRTIGCEPISDVQLNECIHRRWRG